MSLVNSVIFFGALLLGGAVAKVLRIRGISGVAGAGVLACMAVQFAFAVGLLAPSFSMTNSVLMAMVGVGCLEFLRTKGWRNISIRRIDYLGYTLAGALFFAVSLYHVTHPLFFWDARSIWFFHAKIIYHGERMLSPEMWTHPSLSWSHVHYPKLNALLAAEAMRTLGFWNEYLPKLSLSILTLPAMLLAVGYSRSFEMRALIVVGLIMRQGIGITGGYMDGFVAIYAGLAALYAGRFALCRAPGDFVSSVASLGILCGLKQEGAFISVAIVGGALLTMIVSWGIKAACKGAFSSAVSNVALLAVMFAPYAIWSVFKSVGQLGDYFLGQGSMFDRISARAGDGTSISHVLNTIQTVFFDWTSILMVSLVGLFVLYSREGLGRRFTAAGPGLFAAVLYTGTLLIVYLSTPFDMNWHLASSIDRTVMALKALVFSAIVGFVDSSAYWRMGRSVTVPCNEDVVEGRVGRVVAG